MSQNHRNPYIEQTCFEEYRGLTQNFTVGFVSGALVGSVKSSARAEQTGEEDIKQTFKTALQSGIAAAFIAHGAEKAFKGNYGEALVSFAIGGVGVYAIEKLSLNQTDKKEIEHASTK